MKSDKDFLLGIYKKADFINTQKCSTNNTIKRKKLKLIPSYALVVAACFICVPTIIKTVVDIPEPSHNGHIIEQISAPKVMCIDNKQRTLVNENDNLSSSYVVQKILNIGCTFEKKPNTWNPLENQSEYGMVLIGKTQK